jgi:thiol-disulfide isomerase/thioredoxin
MPMDHKLSRRILSIFAYALIAIVVAYLLIDHHPPTLPIGSIAPMDEKFATINGGTVTLRGLLKKPMVINFWATFCPPCLKELPILNNAAKKYYGNVYFFGATIASDSVTIMKLKKEFLIDYDIGAVSESVVEKWRARALPTTYIVNTNGMILWAHTGIVSEELLDHALQSTLKR